jgi:hypothetical protein
VPFLQPAWFCAELHWAILLVCGLQLGAWLGFLVCTIEMLLQHYHGDLQCVKVGHLCGDYQWERRGLMTSCFRQEI